jgi:AcrR family transcriptional regulator
MNDGHSFIVERTFMAIIVDKEQKRRDIALSCTELLLEKGIKKLTVAEVAKTAGVAKGSVYDYFKNKEDIVFEIIRNDIAQFQIDVNNKIKESLTTREKVFIAFDFLLNENNKFEKDQNIYKEYLSIDLSGENPNMSEFNIECGDFIKSMLDSFVKEGIEKGEIKKEAAVLVEGLIALEKGYLIRKWTEKRDIKDEFRRILNTLFNLLEIKK